MRKKIRIKQVFLVLILLLPFHFLRAQNTSVSGVVSDPSGETLIGASVRVVGSSSGTVTDIDGKFVLQGLHPDAVLEISYIGYKTQQVAVDGKHELKIILLKDTQLLDELVVVGYGTMRKSDLTGAVASVNTSEAIKTTPTANITDALQGRLSGVSITSTSGAPGADFTIRVRGMNSLDADGGPLIVVDGIPGGSLASLNPSDIASIEVLKDASATAIYGSKGSNGVILVTTKRPSEGRVNVTYNGYVNFKAPINLPDMLSPYEFAGLVNEYGQEYYASFGQPAKVYYDQGQMDAFKRGENSFDYLGNIFRDSSLEHTHELSVSGGTKSTRFLLSGTYNDNNGTVYNSKAQRVNYRLKVDSEIREWLRAGANVWGDYTTGYGPRFSQYHNMLIQGLTFPNTILPRVNGENSDYNNTNFLGPQYNPMLFINDVYKDNGYATGTRLQGYAEIEPLKGLTFRMTHSFVFNNRLSRGLNRKYSYSYYQNDKNQPSASISNSNGKGWININTLNYIKEFNQDHRINLTAVFEQESSDGFDNNINAVGLLSEETGPYDINKVDGKNSSRNISSSGSRSTSMSWLGRANYVFKNRYMLTASLRYDGSSRLYYPTNTWEYFPSIALAWNIKEERFMERVEFMSQLKLRLGYGETGNQSIPAYSVFDKTRSAQIADGSLATILEYGNPNVWWERTGQYNLGLDMGFFNNRLTVNFDMYDKTSHEVFATMNVPMITGVKTVKGNSATIQNKGFEATIEAYPVSGKNFNWNSSLTFSKNTGIVKDLPSDKKWMDLAGGYENGYFRLFKGEKIATLYGYKNLGVWTTEEVAAGLAPTGFEAGSYKYEDVDGVAGIGPNDKQVIGNGQPDFQWGWNNTLGYKNFDFSLFMIGVHGFDVYNYTEENRITSLGPNPELKNRWKAGVNEHTTVPGFIKNPKFQAPNSRFVEKGDFVKIKSITLGYSLPKSLLDKATLSNLRVYVSVQNPFMITGYSGMDPETTLKTPLTSGIDWGYYPNGRDILVGLNLTF